MLKATKCLDSEINKFLNWEVEALIGLPNFAALYLPLGRLKLIPLIQWVNVHTRASSRDNIVSLNSLFRKLLLPWTENYSFPGRTSLS